MLRFNPKTSDYVLTTNDKTRAEEAGLTLAKNVRGANGELVYFTSDSYAALPFYREAETRVQEKLKPLFGDYERSWATDSPNVYEVGQADTKQRQNGLRSYQNAGVDYALAHPNCLIGDEMGIGKLNPVSTPVLTPSGWLTMGDLKLGDLVATVDGTFTRVSGVFPQGVKRVYRVNFRDGTSAEAGADHLWAVRNGNHRLRGGHYRVKTTAEIKATYDAGPSVNCRYEVPIGEPVQFPERNLLVDPYVLGVLIGDGYICGPSIVFSNPDMDSDIRDEVRKRLPVGARLSDGNCEAGSCPQFRVLPTSTYRSAVDGMGLNVHSADKRIPLAYMQASPKQRMDLLRGLMDTDGSSGGNRIAFHTISPRLAQDVAALVRSLGGISIVRGYDRSHQGKPYEYQVNVKMNECPFYTARKKANWSAPKRGNRVCKFITSVEDTGRDEDSVCIRVEHESHLYVINDYIVTHNTATSIGVANHICAKKVLVICPASIRLNWRKQVKLWSNIRQVRTNPILKGSDGVATWAHYTIISYELARNIGIHLALRAVHWDLIIIDEAHFLKSHTAQRTHAIFGGGQNVELKESLAARADRVICLTGTPIPNRPREAYVMARALNWEAIDYMSYDDFCYRYNPSGLALARGSLMDGTGKTYVREDIGRLPELHARMRCNFMIRRLKKDVLKQLPDKQYEFSYIEPDAKISEVIRRESMLHFSLADLIDPNAEIFGQISTIRREMGEAKVDRCIEHIKYLLDVEEVDKLVVFCHHRSVMDIMLAELQGYGVVTVRGGMSTTAKENSVMGFQTNPKTRLFFGQLDAAGFGIDGLQNVASRMVFVEAAWTPGVNDQAVDRLHRLGQGFPVLAQFLVVEGSLDEKILATVLDKAYTINEVLDQRQAA